MKKAVVYLFLVVQAAALWAGDFIAFPSPLGLAREHFSLNTLWTGFWENERQMGNRADIRLAAPFGLCARAQAVDKRPAPPGGSGPEARTDSGFGLYQRESGSRLVYGKLEISGLAARTRHIWQRGVPWVEAHKASGADLKTDGAPLSPQLLYLNLGSPELRFFKVDGAREPLFGVSGNVSAFFGGDDRLFWQGGSSIRLGKTHRARFEWLVNEKNIAERRQNSWFSEKPALPARDMRFRAFHLVYTHPVFRAAADFARSELFLWGEDYYANGALQIGGRPWRFSFAADGAGERFVGNDGGASGAGFRMAGRVEWFGSKNARLLVETALRSSGTGKPFDRSASKVSYYFPVIRGFLITPARFSFEMERDAVERESIRDRLHFVAGFKLGPARPALRVTIEESAVSQAGDLIIPYPNRAAPHTLELWKAAAEITYPFAFVTFKGSLAYRAQREKEAVWDTMIGASLRGKWGRLSIQLFNDEKDGALNCRFSWRLEKKW